MEEMQQDQMANNTVLPPTPEPTATATPEHKALFGGPVIAVLVVLLVLVLGGLYIWGSTLPEKEANQTAVVEDQQVTAPASDELSDIERDLNVDMVDNEAALGEIDAAFEAEAR